jgi:hypothetical protein
MLLLSRGKAIVAMELGKKLQQLEGSDFWKEVAFQIGKR